MKTIAQFTIYKDGKTYIAEGVNLAVVTHASTLDALMKRIKEAIDLYFDE